MFKQRLLNLTDEEYIELFNHIKTEKDLEFSCIYDVDDYHLYDWWFDNMEAFDDEFCDEDGYVYWDDFDAFLKKLDEEGYIDLNHKYAYIDFEGDLLTSCNDPREVLSPDEIIDLCTPEELEDLLNGNFDHSSTIIV